MKSNFYALSLICISTMSVAQNSIPNGNFENWTSGTYEYPQNYPFTSNFESHGSAGFPNTPFNLTKTTDAYHGTNAVQLTTVVSSKGDTMPAYFINANPNQKSPNQWTGGIPYSQKPIGIRGYYKYNIASADSGSILVTFSKAGVNIGTYFFEVGGIHNTYTLFNFTFSPALTATPDSVIFAAISCKFSGGNGKLTGIPGSTFKLDSLSFTGVSSQPTLMNGDLEMWQQAQTPYILSNWYSNGGGNSGNGVYRTTDAVSGYAAELITALGSDQNGNPRTSSAQISTGYWPQNCSGNCTELGGYPFSNQIDTLVFSYKYVPSGNDSAHVDLLFKKNGLQIWGFGKNLGASASYQVVQIPFNVGQPVDTAMINIQSSLWQDSALSFVGSNLKIDGVHFKSQAAVTAPLSLVATANPVTCVGGGHDGYASVTASNGTPPYTYLWSNGGTSVSINNLTPGNYSVTVTDATNSSKTAVASVAGSNVNFSLAFSASPQTGSAPLQVAFNNNTPNMSNYDFTWYFGDGNNNTSNSGTLFYTYQYGGLYDVVLIATSHSTGCSDTLVRTGYISIAGAACTHTATITPAGTITKCQGDTVVISSNTDPSFMYQWNIYGIAISGATSSKLSVTQDGYYSVTISKNNCPVTSAAVHVTFSATHPQQPAITSAGTIVPCVGGTETLTASTISGVTYSWNTTPVKTTTSIVVSSSSNYVVTVTNSAGCTSASAPFTVNTTQAQVPICMVTVDSTSAKNLIVWDKPANASIDSFRIYRQIASSYTHIGSVAYSALSEFMDNTNGVNPNITSYKYEISLMDTCGNESALSNYHRTLHLSVSPASPCGYNLFWNDYVGFPITQYRILRDSAHAGWKTIDSVSYGNTSWTDITCYKASDSVAYVLEIDNPSGCTVSLKMPQPMNSNLNSSRSNIYRVEENNSSVINLDAAMSALVYPNPSNGCLTIDMKNNIASLSVIRVFNMMGEEVRYINCAGCSNKITMDMSKQAQGVYYLQISTSEQTITKKIVIE